MAQLVSDIGGTKVAVDLVVPSGADPFTFVPGGAVAAALRHDALVIEYGGGLQPAIEAAAAGNHPLELGAGRPGAPGFVWLDPAEAVDAVAAVTAAMAAADPAAAPLFRRNASGVSAELRSQAIDYENTLSSCPGHTLVTPDEAFGGLAAAVGLRDIVVGAAPSPAELSSVRAQLPSTSPAAAVDEPWVDDSGVDALAAAAHLKKVTLDTLVGPPSGTTGYFEAMDKNLSALSSALGCSVEEQ